MNFRAWRQVSCGCCSLALVVGGTLTVVLVLHVMRDYTTQLHKKDIAGVTQVLAGYSSTSAHSLLSEGIDTMRSQINTDQSETTIEQRTNEISKASLKYQRKEEPSTITTNKDMAGVTEVIAGDSSTAAHSLLSEAFHTMESQRNTDQSETKIEQRTSESSKASLKYQTKEETSTVTANKEMEQIGCGVFDGKKSCYNITVSLGSFDVMTKLCKKLNMQMAVLETWEEYKFISNIIKRDNMTKQMYISLKKIYGTFYWIYPNDDTLQLDYGEQSAWAPGEPGTYTCVYFWNWYPGKWDDYLCSYDHFTICEVMY